MSRDPFPYAVGDRVVFAEVGGLHLTYREVMEVVQLERMGDAQPNRVHVRFSDGQVRSYWTTDLELAEVQE